MILGLPIWAFIIVVLFSLFIASILGAFFLYILFDV